MLSSARIELRVSGEVSQASPNALAPATAPFNVSWLKTLTNGVALDKADRVYVLRAAASTTPTDIDISGSLKDVVNDTFVAAKVVGVILINNSTTVGEIISFGGDTAAVAAFFDAADNFVKVGPGGIFVLIDPSLAAYAVTATTADVLQIVAAAGTPSYDLVIIARSA